MTDVELDVAGADVYDCVKTFLTYCPAGSEESATENAMEYVKSKFSSPSINNFEYRKLCDAARAAYCDITKKPLNKFRPQRRNQGNR